MSGIDLRRRPLPAALGVALALCAVLVLAGVAGAQGKRCHPGGYAVEAWQISDGSGAAGAPATDGCLVVWADDRNGDLDIFAYDLEAETESAVRVAAGDQTDPVVADGQVYWVDRSGDAPVVWTADPGTGAAAPVSGAGADQPAATGGYVVWSQATLAGRDIVALDRTSGRTFVVCAAPGDQVKPAASHRFIAWEDYRNGAEADVYAWDVCDDEEIPVSVVAGNQTAPSVYGSVVLWADDRSGDWDVYGADAHDLWLEWAEHHHAPARGCDTSRLEFVVADGPGDQVAPVVSGSLAFWTDLGADTLGDIAGADLTWGDPFEVAVGEGAQTDVAAGADGGFAAWLDASGAAPVVRGGRVEWVEGDDGGEEPGPVPQWTTEDVVTLFLGVLSELDVFDEVRFAVDDAEYGEWQSLEDTEAVKLPSVDGAHVIHIQLANSGFDAGAPGGEGLPFEISVTTTLDTHGPVTAAKRVAARRGAMGTLRFKVRDGLSSTADISLRIKDRAGKVVKVVDVGSKATNKMLGKRVKVDLKRGRYTVKVLARDLAGNRQRRAVTSVLTVR